MSLGDPSSSVKVFLLRVGATVFAAGFIIKGYLPVLPKKIFYGIIVFLLATLVPVLYSGHFATSFIGIYPFYHSSGLSVLCFVFFFLYSSSLNKKHLPELFKVLVLTSFFVSMYGIFQYAGLDFLRWKGKFYPRIWSTLGNPNFLAAYLCMLIPVALALYLKTGGWFSGSVFLLNAAALVLTSSRAGAVSAFAGSIFTLFIIKKDALIKKRLKKISVAMLLIIIVSGFINYERFKSMGRRYLSSFDLNEVNIASRLSQWDTARKMFFEKPVFGWGTNGYYIHFRKYMKRDFLNYTAALSVPGYPHNYFLKILVSGGWIFSILIFGWWILVFIYIYRNRYKMNFIAAAVLGSFIALTVQNLFSFSVVTTSVIIWSLLGCGVAGSEDVRELKLSRFKFRYVLLVPLLVFLVFAYNRLYADHMFYREEFEKAVKKAPEVQKYGMIYGKKFYIQGKYGEAKKIFNEQIKRNSFNALTYNAVGSVYLKEGDLKNAEFYFKEALKRDPYLVDAHLKLAGVYRQTGNYRDSAMHYSVALDITPGLTNPRYNLGVIYFKQKKFNKALVEWRKVLEYKPDHQKSIKNISIAEDRQQQKNIEKR